MSHSMPNTQQRGDVRIAKLSGGKVRVWEDLTDGELEELPDESSGCDLLLDFSNVGYVNSDDLGAIINLHRRMKTVGGRLTLINLNAEVYEVFTATHLHTYLTIR